MAVQLLLMSPFLESKEIPYLLWNCVLTAGNTGSVFCLI